jgi:hypothetical protein
MEMFETHKGIQKGGKKIASEKKFFLEAFIF